MRIRFYLASRTDERSFSQGRGIFYRQAYGIPTYPYRWTTLPEHMTIRLDMGYRGANRYVAAFAFEFTSSIPEARCHVSVWIIRPHDDPTVEGFATLPSKDTRLHTEARSQFIGVLLGLRSHYVVSTPQEGEETPSVVLDVQVTPILRSDGSRPGVAPPP